MSTDDQSIAVPGTFTFKPVKWPMKIIFAGLGELAPTDDITPKEAVQLSMMLACAQVSSVDMVDFAGFVKEHGLERHFKAQRT